jgi:glutaredoxin
MVSLPTAVMLCSLVPMTLSAVRGAPPPGPATRCVALEIYLHATRPTDVAILQAARDVIESRRGTVLTVHDLDGGQRDTARQRLQAVTAHYHRDPQSTPLIYGCNQTIQGTMSDESLRRALQALLRVDVYTRTGCPRCGRAKQWLSQIAARYPGLEFRERDLLQDARAPRDLELLVRRHPQGATSVPVFHLCDKLVVGFDEEATSGARVEALLSPWTYVCPATSSRPGAQTNVRSDAPMVTVQSLPAMVSGTPGLLVIPWLALAGSAPDEGGLPPLPLPTDEPTADPIDPAGPMIEGLPLPGSPEVLPGVSDVIELPLLGRVKVSRLGLPLFTVAVGLVDGFNPCAMWVLLFLLSILVNLKDRMRILAVAGTFVLISGLAYYAFMAAWLNVFRFVGLLRPVQVLLALTAIFVGAVHIKDFFAIKQGLTLSIPESARPGIYARVRRIVTAENLLGALMGAAVLAVMVNIVELLCTAGLPALYTEILTLQQVGIWQSYAYLALYNLAYMFDDALMVGLVVLTLGRRKMQERHGRMLKLVSGSVILVLGVVMLVRPDWLV